MDSPTPQPVQQPQVVQCQCRHCRRHGWGFIGSFFRFIGLIVMLALVFVAGLAIGGFGPAGMWPFGHDMLWSGGDIGAPRTMMLNGDAQGFNIRMSKGDRLFGVVTAIVGQKITIADNGGGTQTIVASSDTVVLDGQKEVPVWTLRKGNSIRVMGPTKDALITAHLIEIIR